MKQMHFLPAVMIIMIIVAFTSCKPSRVWATKEKQRPVKERDYEDRKDDYEDRRYEPTPPPLPRNYSTTALILTPSAGFVMNRYPDGRYYHKSVEGFIYWKAFDNRFYLDRSYIHRVRYNSNEYEVWNSYYRSQNNRGY